MLLTAPAASSTRNHCGSAVTVCGGAAAVAAAVAVATVAATPRCVRALASRVRLPSQGTLLHRQHRVVTTSLLRAARSHSPGADPQPVINRSGGIII